MITITCSLYIDDNINIHGFNETLSILSPQSVKENYIL